MDGFRPRVPPERTGVVVPQRPLVDQPRDAMPLPPLPPVPPQMPMQPVRQPQPSQQQSLRALPAWHSGSVASPEPYSPSATPPSPSEPISPQQEAYPPVEPAERVNYNQPKRSVFVNPFVIILMLIVVLAAGAFATYTWYDGQLTARDPSGEADVRKMEIKSGMTWGQVGTQLEEYGVIRNAMAFDVYARLNGSLLKEGTCAVSPAEAVPEIVKQLAAGCHDFKSVMFYPGATIEKPLYKPDYATLDQTMYVKNILKQAGYSDAEITSALAKTYDGPLFADKPAGTTLEGYIYGQTYYVDTNASAEKVLQATFDQMYADITEYDMIPKFKAHDLNLYQAITMASIVQRELNCEGKPTEERKERCYQYQRTIAQVFLKRYKEGMQLGSDVTFIYAADMMGVAPQTDLDSPYNTRKYAGLPPGPIASPGLLALRAVADPTDTDYVFFVAGDDGLIYFAKTLAEHEANIKNHCQQLCEL